MYSKIIAPDASYHFNRWWQPTCPLNKRERRLATLRTLHGNIEGRRKYIIECYGPEMAEWL